MQSIQDKILARIKIKGTGWSFSKNYFYDLGSDGSIRLALMRIEGDGKIRLVCRGIYDCPKYSELLLKTLSPDFDQAAQAIARKSGWTIHPSGAAALNLLGLSTQVPANILYLSDGPRRREALSASKSVNNSLNANNESDGVAASSCPPG